MATAILFVVRCKPAAGAKCKASRSISNREEIFRALAAATNRTVVMARLSTDQGFGHHYCLFRSFGVVLAMHGGALGLVSFMSPGQALVEVHPFVRRGQGFRDYVHAAVSLGVTYRAVYGGAAWKAEPNGNQLGVTNKPVQVALVLDAVREASYAAARDRARLLAMVRNSNGRARV